MAVEQVSDIKCPICGMGCTVIDQIGKYIQFLHSLRDNGCYEECYNKDDKECLDGLIAVCERIWSLYGRR